MGFFSFGDKGGINNLKATKYIYDINFLTMYVTHASIFIALVPV